MHKYRALPAKAEDNAAYNPFSKIRKASVYAEPEGDEDQKPGDSENFVAELVRRGTKELTFVKYNHATVEDQKDSRGEKPVVPLLPHVDEEKLPYSLEDQPAEAIEPRSITRRQSAFLIWRQWRRRLLGNQWEVRPAIANIATSAIAFAPLTHELADPQLHRHGNARAPRVRTFCQTKEKDEHHKDVFAGLKDLTDELGELLRKTNESTHNVRPYVQDDVKAFHHLISDFSINSPAFSRNRTNFCDWVLGENMEHLSAWQTAFWRPSYDRARNVVRAAFGLEYLVPQLHSVSVLEGHSRFSKIPRLKAMVESSDDVHDHSLQRLSIYIQLPRVRAISSPPAGADRFVQATVTSQGIIRAQKARLACESTVIVLDSHQKALATAPLIAGEEPWQELLDSLEEPHHQSPYRLALSVVELAFESVAARWSHYILSMHNYLASLEEHVYENPADDTRTGALWSVSKQLLQAERLLRFHILLLENIQNDFKGLEQEDAMPLDWLQPNLTEFRRLSSEVEETLKKPTVHMVDLMYKSISIRDARQSLQLNTSLWRLSWVTFIFLPLTFLAGFFGMNIEEFQDNPAMKWYFIVAAPLMCIVLLSWLVVRTWTHKSPWNGSRMSISTEKL
ncbi:MAG: hypothetical protein Q9171_005194 [Xanthocarpia ochracea]